MISNLLRVYFSRHSASTMCYMTQWPDRSYQKSSAAKRQHACAIEIDNAHCLSQLFVPSIVALQYSISYHMIREAVASVACRMAKQYTKTNLSEVFTKVILRPKKELFLDRFTY